MTTMITAKVDSQQRETEEKGFSEVERLVGIKTGIADDKYVFKSDFDKKFDEMDTDVAEMFC